MKLQTINLEIPDGICRESVITSIVDKVTPEIATSPEVYPLLNYLVGKFEAIPGVVIIGEV